MLVHNIYFSARGTTAKCAAAIAPRLGANVRSYNWLAAEQRRAPEIHAEDVMLFSMPVYGGFIPALCAEAAKKLSGSGAPAVIAAIYGNRHYDYALIQMRDILTRRGFPVVAAGAFLAEHSIFPAVAAGRPDKKDEAAMAAFAGKCAALLPQRELWAGRVLELSGAGYDPSAYKGVPFKPEGDECCVKCGRCAALCPAGAISAETPRMTDAELCISCGACIKACPTGARGYHSEQYAKASEAFAARCSERREPETFFVA